MAEDTKDRDLQEIGKTAMAAIAEMVAALECDYDRLEELRDERDELVEAEKESREALSAYGTVAAEDVEGEAEYSELDEALTAAVNALKEWRDDYADELAELESAAGDCEDREEAETRIQEDPLSLTFRSGWVTSKDEMEPEEFELLLGTGGPAVRIIGEINQGEPDHVRLQTQDWFTPWTDYRNQDTEVLEKYCRCFCFEL